jgi:hypothetical protein
MKYFFLPMISERPSQQPGSLAAQNRHLTRLATLCAMLCLPAWLHADPLAEVAAFSSLPKIDMAKVEKGEIVSARSRGMTFSRGQSVESVFVVDAPLEKTVESLREWNGSAHADLKIYLHGDLTGNPSPADFKKLAGVPNNASVRAFAAATEKLNPNSTDLQVSAADAEEAAKKVAGSGGGMSPQIAAFWSDLLDKRLHAFLSGGLPAQPPYGAGGRKIEPAGEIDALLKAQPKLREQFRSLLEASGMNGKPSGKPSLYWELVDAEGQATASLGASFFSNSGKSTQGVDVQYYASGNYYVFLTLSQVWPIQIGSRQESLVWRGDLLSSASFGTLHGMERNAAGSAMAIELKRLITYFQKDTAAH